MTASMQRDAAALIAHELRVPIGVILGYASLLLDGSFEGKPDHQRMAVEKIAKQGHNLSALFDALLVSLAGKDGRQLTDLRAVMHLAVDRMQDRAALEASRVVTIGVDEDEDEIPVMVLASPAHVLCILTCLICNALI